MAETRVPPELRKEIATVARDISHWFYGDILLPRDDTLLSRGGGRGLWIYDDLERDGRVFSVMQKRKNALLAYPWQLDAASEAPADKAAKELAERHLKALNFNQMVVNLLDAILKGFAVGEIMWGLDGGEIVPIEVRPRDQKRFKFTIDYELRLVTFANMLEGEALPARKFIVHSTGAKDGSPYGLGLGTRLFWPVLFKKQDISFWLVFLDKFGSPTSVGKYPQGTEHSEQQKLLAALQAIAQDAGIAIPDNMTVELLEATRSGSIDAYERLARYMDEQIAEIALGETLSTNIGSVGSMAAATTHNDVRLELSQGDGELLSATLNRSLIAWDVELNMPGAKPPKLSFVTDAGEDLNLRANRDKTIFDMGYKPTLAYITETYGGEWEAKPEPPPPSPFGAPPPGAVTGEDSPEFAEHDRSPTVDRFTDRLADQVADPIEAMVAAVRVVFAESASLEEARDRLIEIYPKLSGRDFAQLMTRALAASDLAGRLEAKR